MNSTSVPKFACSCSSFRRSVDLPTPRRPNTKRCRRDAVSFEDPDARGHKLHGAGVGVRPGGVLERR